MSYISMSRDRRLMTSSKEREEFIGGNTEGYVGDISLGARDVRAHHFQTFIN